MQTSKDFSGNLCGKLHPAGRVAQPILVKPGVGALSPIARMSDAAEDATTERLSLVASASSLLHRSSRILREFLARTGCASADWREASIHSDCGLPPSLVVSESQHIQGAARGVNPHFIPRFTSRLIFGAAGCVALLFLSSCAHCPMCGKCGQGMMAKPSAKASAKEPTMHHGSGRMHRSGHLASGDGEGQPASTPVSQQRSAKAKRANASEPAANKGSEAAPNALETPVPRSFR